MEENPHDAPVTDSIRSLSIKQPKKFDQACVDELMDSYKKTDQEMKQKMEVMENIDLYVSIITYKTYEATNEFKTKIAEIKGERDRVLTTTENQSELSLLIHDLDRKISDLQRQLELRIMRLNQQKIENQEHMETISVELEMDFKQIKEIFQNIQSHVHVDPGTQYRSQALMIRENYTTIMEEMQQTITQYEKLNLSGWKAVTSETKLADVLEENGLKFTRSGLLLTNSGSHITFDEAQHRGYFDSIGTSINKIIAIVKDQEEQQDHPSKASSTTSESDRASSSESKISSEDVKYLKLTVGKPLTLALAEITAKQPRDPIHYLGHYLFKYRYNQEIEEVQKREIDELTSERKRIFKERWHRFIEDEARNAVVDMILNAEMLAYQKEMRRIAEEIAEQEEEEEGDLNEAHLAEEAKDKFE